MAPTVTQAEEASGLFVRIDNDLFTGTDREYTNGVQVGSTSATVESFDDAEFAPSLRWANDKLRWLQPKGFEENNVTWTIGQRMFTPEDWRLEEPDPRDRPYAGLLFAGLTYNGRDSHSLRSTSLDVGIVGPSALAEQAQNLVHEAAGVDRFLGWDHQLNDEPVFRILHERFRRWDITARAQVRLTSRPTTAAASATSRPSPTRARNCASAGACPTTSVRRRLLRTAKTRRPRAGADRRAACRFTASSRSTHASCCTTSRSMATRGATARASSENPTSRRSRSAWPSLARMAGHVGHRLPHEGIRDSRQRGQLRNADVPPRARAPMSSEAQRPRPGIAQGRSESQRLRR